MLGYSESEMMGKSLFDFIDPKMIQNVKVIIDNLAARTSKANMNMSSHAKMARNQY